ncbi:mannose-1-phosphate guanylyltransferase [Sphingomonas sp. KRR8]|uniref:mannose-1-phosphate guanylyltransferase n=1 Tax=Sphingomonas sp. KRR8 TaxID=2942996 RepID=UPI0020219F74|nr:mannose-1-phosphate guanylyltransferase [Sphingomonas sp. KRR8]URD60537.1 mannose-1-phosphate guanylyltransferase [Sphingomonas sp. KRR8]
MIVPVILSGGSGTRLWPLSTPERPKQFLPLTGKQSLFAETLARVAGDQGYGPPVIVANAAHERLCGEELAGRPATLILEPIARNTAVAIAMAALVVAEQDPSALLLVMPSDHRIGQVDRFHEAVVRGSRAAETGRLITFGINPTGPETGYGYLEAGNACQGLDGVLAVERFIEKPDQRSAEAMIATGRFFWNGGIFLYSAATFLAECERLAAPVFESAVKALRDAHRDGSTVRPSREQLEFCPDISVDYAVMERSDRIAMVPLDADWSDVGSWDALAEVSDGGAAANLVDCDDCFVRSDGARISMLGVEGLIVVAKGDQVVIMRKGRSQEIKQLAATA